MNDSQQRWLDERTPDMNEHDAWQVMKPNLDSIGVPTRLENAAASSVPDVLFVAGRLMMFIELKMNYGGCILMNRFQYAYAKRISHHIRPHMHWVAVYVREEDAFFMFTFKRVDSMEFEVKAQGGKLQFYWPPVWEKMPKKFMLATQADYDEWFDIIKGLEFSS